MTNRGNNQALAFRAWVQDEHRFLESCDGGDVGSPSSPSIWLFGLEPGWSLSDQRQEDAGNGDQDDLMKVYAVEQQLGWPFNRNAFKLLFALNGGDPADYVEFARAVRPFEQGCKGYFKGNLFPVPLHCMNAWDAAARDQTGFETKLAYQAWLREVRFPIVSSWVARCRPKLLICTGLTHLQDFLAVARTTQAQRHTFTVNGHTKRMYLSSSGLVPMAVIPHLSGGAHGLNSNEALMRAAELMRSGL